jgi:ceramide glucosyltransferase
VTPVDAALLSWATVVASVYGVAAARSLRRPVPSGLSRPPSSLSTPLLVVRPCAGLEASLPLTLSSLGALADDPSHRALVRLRYAVATPGDPAVPAIALACGRLSALGLDARLVVTGATAPNQKSDQLARVIAAEPGAPVVVNVDSDVDLSTFDWEALLSPLSDPSVAAVWAPPHEAPGETFADRASEALLGGSLHAFTLLSGIDGGGLVGKVVAMRRSALEAIGGFGSLGHHLGEDMELARRWRAQGARVVASRGVAVARVSGRSPGAVVARYGRWLSVIRAQRPALLASYPALFFATPLLALAATVAVLAGRAGAPSLGAEALVLLLRGAVGWAAARASGRARGIAPVLTDAVLADALLGWAFVRALRTRSVSWRGRALRIAPGGELSEVR